MSTKKKSPPASMAPMGPLERMKYEVAEELGLLPRVLEVGWGGLTAGETGRIGGLVRAKRKAQATQAAAPPTK